MTPEEHASAVRTVDQVLAYYAAIPTEHLQVLDWSQGHERTFPGECCHCHSPSLTYLIDDVGRYSHKLCAESPTTSPTATRTDRHHTTNDPRPLHHRGIQASRQPHYESRRDHHA